MYSSLRMPRIHTQAVSWYSGLPTRFPIRSFGSRMPLWRLMKMQEWRKYREGKTGMATNGLGIAEHGKRVGGERHFGDVKFPVADHPEKSFLDGDVDVRQVDPVDGDAVLEQRARAVIIPAGHRQAKLGHLESLRGAISRPRDSDKSKRSFPLSSGTVGSKVAPHGSNTLRWTFMRMAGGFGGMGTQRGMASRAERGPRRARGGSADESKKKPRGFWINCRKFGR